MADGKSKVVPCELRCPKCGAVVVGHKGHVGKKHKRCSGRATGIDVESMRKRIEQAEAAGEEYRGPLQFFTGFSKQNCGTWMTA